MFHDYTVANRERVPARDVKAGDKLVVRHPHADTISRCRDRLSCDTVWLAFTNKDGNRVLQPKLSAAVIVPPDMWVWRMKRDRRSDRAPEVRTRADEKGRLSLAEAWEVVGDRRW
ncbi:hypothetical protein [Streptomyces scopuliridis]|uniref:hypothetical protein n=1 Tax=Streptomyces scopuliridis TaxID=452529 RepID=UPI00368F8901